jgi:hypothetical protein
MQRFAIEGRYYEADTYKTAREMHQSWKAGQAGGGVESAASAAVTPTPVVKARPIPPAKPQALRAPSLVAPVVAPAATAVVATSAAAGIASELKLYRGDERAADVIARDGFQLWGDAVAGVSAAGGIAEFILHKLYLAYANERDIERYIVTAKDRARPTISTSRNEGCGGYDSGNIYRIEYGASDLQEYAFDEVMKAYKPTLTGTKFPNFKLYMDKPDIKTARQIALDLNIATQEVVYFRHVPGNRITQYKPKGAVAFQAMPAAAAKPRLW